MEVDDVGSEDDELPALICRGPGDDAMDIDGGAASHDPQHVTTTLVSESVQTRRQRRRQRWAVDLQPDISRPACCKNCLVPFSSGDVRATI